MLNKIDLSLGLFQILFFAVILINFLFDNLFSEIAFIWIAGILLVISIILFLVKAK